MERTDEKRLVSMSRLLYRIGGSLSLNELRCLIQYEGVPVYTDGRTRTRYLDEKGRAKVDEIVERYRKGRLDYFFPKVHPIFAEKEDESGK